MSDRPPPPLPSLTQEERDAILRRLDGGYALLRGQIGMLGPKVEDHDRRIVVLEKDRRERLEQEAGIGVDVFLDGPPSHLSPPPPPQDALPPMRPRMSTHESLGMLAAQQAKTAAETAAQTPMIQKAVETSQKVVDANKQSNARLLGVFAGAALLYMSQNCTIPQHLFHPAPPPSVTASAPPPSPPTASSR